MTLKNNRTPLQCCVKLYASFYSQQWIQTKVKFGIEIGDFFVPCDLEIWRMTLKNNLAPLLCYYKFCASFRSHWWMQTGVTVQKRPIWVKIDDFLALWPWSLTDDLKKNNRILFLSNIKLYASFHHHIQTGVTVRKRLSWVMTSVILTFDRWPWPFAWTSLPSLVIFPEISWWYDDGNIVKKVWRTDRRTDRHRDRRTEPFIELLGRSYKNVQL